MGESMSSSHQRVAINIKERTANHSRRDDSRLFSSDDDGCSVDDDLHAAVDAASSAGIDDVDAWRQLEGAGVARVRLTEYVGTAKGDSADGSEVRSGRHRHLVLTHADDDRLSSDPAAGDHLLCEPARHDDDWVLR